jgi:dTMP kinase
VRETDSDGLFLVFEGVEGAGKSSHLQRLTRALDDRNIAYVMVREPGGTPVGERARDIVLDPSISVTPEAELLLYLAARAEFVRTLVRPALDRGELVLADRFELSTYAYQGCARGLGLDRVRTLNEFATGGLKPDGTIVLRVDPVLGRGRQKGAADRLEREEASFHRAVAAAYDELARTEPGVIVVDSGGPIREVQRSIWDVLHDRWPGRFPAWS